MEPMTMAAIGIGIASLAKGLYDAYQQKKISDKEYKQKKEALDNLEKKLQAPSGEIEPITFQEYKMIQEYSPELAQYVEEKSPELIQEASQTERVLQQDALAKFAAQAETGTDKISEAQREQAAFEAAAAEKSRRNQILADMAARGLGGSGQELLAQLQGSQAAAQSQREAALQAVQGAEQRRLAALSNQANLASQIRQQNLRPEEINTEIMNSYNQRLANAKNLYNQQTANVRNEAQKYNISNKAMVDNLNTEGTNKVNALNVIRKQAALDRKMDIENENVRSVFGANNDITSGRANADRKYASDITQSIMGGFSSGASAYGQMANAPKTAGMYSTVAQENALKDREK